MSTPKRVDDKTAQEVIGEMAYKYPNFTNRELYAICRERRQCPVSLKQVNEAMRAIRAATKKAFNSW